jgi:hypothetical protein
MKKDFRTSKANSCKINSIKIEQASIESWLAKNSKKTVAEKNKKVGISECPAPWG